MKFVDIGKNTGGEGGALDRTLARGVQHAAEIGAQRFVGRHAAALAGRAAVAAVVVADDGEAEAVETPCDVVVAVDVFAQAVHQHGDAAARVGGGPDAQVQGKAVVGDHGIHARQSRPVRGRRHRVGHQPAGMLRSLSNPAATTMRRTMTPPASDAITFRPATSDDALCLGVLSTQVFLDTYATQGIRRAVANEALALHSVAAYEALLADAGVTILLAECAGHLVGFSQVEDGEGHAQVPAAAASELRRLYVQERFTGRGLGRDLLRQAEKAAAARGAEMLLAHGVGRQRARAAVLSALRLRRSGGTVYTIEGEEFPNRLFGKRVRHVALA